MPHPLASNLDDLLSIYMSNEAVVSRYPSRYDILFQKGAAQLLVTVDFETRSYQVGGSVPVAARTFEAVYDASVLFGRARDFLRAVALLPVTEAKRP